jgi:arginase
MSHIEVVFAEIGEGARIVQCKAGPAALQQRLQDLQSHKLTIALGQTVTSDASLGSKMAIVEDYMPRLASAVDAVMKREVFPVVIGGDHSCAIGTWSAIAKTYRDRGDIGLIWIDAHLDSHTPETSESGAPHGMPLAHLLGKGNDKLTSIADALPKFKPENVVVIGARSSEAGEEQLLASMGVRVMRIEEVQQKGFLYCLGEAIEIVTKNTIGFGITFDVDSIDPKQAPGVGSPEENGLDAWEVVTAFEVMDKTKLVGFELVEYNPERDVDFETEDVCIEILYAAVSGT